MSSEWYYMQNGSACGPIGAEGLKQLAVSGNLQPSDQVWKEGMAEWAPASRIKGLFQHLQKAPPANLTSPNSQVEAPLDFLGTRLPDETLGSNPSVRRTTSKKASVSSLKVVLSIFAAIGCLLVAVAVLSVASSVQKPAGNKSSFDRDNFATTMSWFGEREKEVSTLLDENKLAGEAELKKYERELKSLASQKVRWKCLVVKVTDKIVDISGGISDIALTRRGDIVGVHEPHILCFSNSAYKAEAYNEANSFLLSKQVLGDGRYENNERALKGYLEEKLVIGEHISKNAAAKLRKDDVVVIEATIDQVFSKFAYEQLGSFRIGLKNIRVVAVNTD